MQFNWVIPSTCYNCNVIYIDMKHEISNMKTWCCQSLSHNSKLETSKNWYQSVIKQALCGQRSVVTLITTQLLMTQWHRTAWHDAMPHLLLMFNNNSLCLFHGVRFCDRVEVYSYACACLPSWTPHKVWVPSGVSVSRANVIIMRAAATKAKFKFILVTTEHLYPGSCSDSECYKQTMRV